MDWTTEVVFQPPPTLDRTLPPIQPTTVTIAPQPSSATLHHVLSLAFESRDRKGKSKVSTPDETKWNLAERAWLDTNAPAPAPVPVAEPEIVTTSADLVREDAEASTSAIPPPPAIAPPTPALATPIPAPIPDAESPFLLLLAAYFPPIPAPPPSEDAPPPPPPSRPTRPRPTPRKLYSLSPLSTLRLSLSGTTLLEFPTLELWTRESFLRARAKGEVELLDPPKLAVIPVRRAEGESGSWERGRGRGRERGRGAVRGGRGRGGASGGGERREEVEERTQDSGWGKRAAPTPVAAEGGGAEQAPRPEKRVMIEEVAVEQASLEGGSRLVDYGSD